METIQGIAIIPLILGVVEMVKRIGLPAKYSPILAVILGNAVAFLELGFTGGAILAGTAIGLSASGLWSGTKSLMKK